MKLFAALVIGTFAQTAFSAGINIDPINGINTGGAPVTNLPEPLNPSDAATKAYIDGLLGGLTTPAAVEKTGQTVTYVSGDDGDTQRGVDFPNPRFTDNQDGTVSDNLTGLIWLKNASCITFYAGDGAANNIRNWTDALNSADDLADGHCDLTDGSIAGDWRLPNVKELQSLIYFGYNGPALSDTQGTGQWSENNPFINIGTGGNYWSSTSKSSTTLAAWIVGLSYGDVSAPGKSNNRSVWPIREGH